MAGGALAASSERLSTPPGNWAGGAVVSVVASRVRAATEALTSWLCMTMAAPMTPNQAATTPAPIRRPVRRAGMSASAGARRWASGISVRRSGVAVLTLWGLVLPQSEVTG